MKTPRLFRSSCLFFRIILIFSFTVLACVSGIAQKPETKLSPALAREIAAGRFTGQQLFDITIRKGSVPSTLSDLAYRASLLHQSTGFSIYRIEATLTDIENVFLPEPAVIFVENGRRVAKEEILIDRLDLSVNKINLAHRRFPSIDGNGIVVSIKENKPDTLDIDLKGRFLSTHLSSSITSSHATIMATIIGGGGNTWHLGKGAAWGGTISSSGFTILLPEANSDYQLYNISVQNHSYGVGVESYYGADAAAYDASAISKPDLLHVFSSGNSGTASATTGPYAGISGFANITGSFKMAKNVLVVGATDSFHTVPALSSKGPAHDGRVKPELVAFGEDGSSGAAALVSGSAMLLQQMYKQSTGSLPSNALVRAILVNSADDTGPAEVDYQSGFGSLNTQRALQHLQNGRFLSGSLSAGNNQVFSLSVPAGLRKLKITLTWNDPPAAPNAPKALINDLDLDLTHVASTQNWKPWVLSSFPHRDSLQLPATRKRDSLNNIEQVTVLNPVAGNYQVKVNAFNIPSGTQTFYLAYQYDSVDVFEWEFPASNDYIFSATNNTIRWRSGFSVTTGTLEYSIDNGNNWITIQNNIPLQPGYYSWNTPALISRALLRMSIGSNSFVSDTFTISRRPITKVGFNCPDSFLVYWDRIPGASSYRYYDLGTKYLVPRFTTTDTAVVLAKSVFPSHYFAIAPLLGSREAVKSYTLDYTQQGVGCYVRSLLGQIVINNGELTLSLGTLYNINTIILEKWDGTQFVPITQLPPSALQLVFTDYSLKKGLNIYRVKIVLAGGGIVYSPTETIYNFDGSPFLIFPNPVSQYQPLKIYSDLADPVNVQVLNSTGQLMYEQLINQFYNEIPAGILGKGVYFLRFVEEGKKPGVFKVVVY
jgi:hypothetical protein